MLLSIAPEILVVAFALLLGLTYSTNSLLLNLIERKKAAIRDSAADSVDAADLP